VSEWRLNFGNGQVHFCRSREDAKRQLASLGDGHTFVQRVDTLTGDWYRAKP
jgi:hypothetical protein